MTSIVCALPPAHSGSSYQHLSARGKVDISAVCVGVMAAFEGKSAGTSGSVLGAVAPVPLRAIKAEVLLQGQPWTPELSLPGRGPGRGRSPAHLRCPGQRRLPEKKWCRFFTRRALAEAQKRARKHSGKRKGSLMKAFNPDRKRGAPKRRRGQGPGNGPLYG